MSFSDILMSYAHAKAAQTKKKIHDNFSGSLLDRAGQAQQADPTAPRDPNAHASLLQILDSVVLNGRVARANDDAQLRAGRGQADQQFAQTTQAANLSPIERLALMTNPGKFGENYSGQTAQNYGSHSVAPGASLHNGLTNQLTTAPMMVDHGGQYGNLTPEGYQWLGTAQQSYGDITAQQQAEAAQRQAASAEQARQTQAKLANMQFLETGRHNRATEGIQGRREGRLGAGGGVGLPTGAPVRSADPMAAVEAELRKRGVIK